MRLLHVDKGYLEGDPWLQAYKQFQDRDYQPEVRKVRAWWDASCTQLTAGILHLDRAICALLGWRAAQTLALGVLRKDFGYPDPEPVYEKWLDSF